MPLFTETRQDEAMAILNSADSTRPDDPNKPANLEEAALFYLDHPVDWAEDMLGIQLDPWQAEAITKLLETHFVAVRSGHSVGKSTAMAVIGLWFLATHPY